MRRSIAAAFAVALVATSLGTAWTSRTPTTFARIDPSLSAGEVAVVHTTAGLAGALSLRLSDLGAVDLQTYDGADTVVARLTTDALRAVATDPAVATATQDTPIVALGRGGRFEKRLLTTDDPSLLAVRAPSAWTQTTGDGVTVAIMDSGIADHPDLPAGKVRARVNFTHDGSPFNDPGGHGTFIAGLIAANGAMKGVAPNASLVDLRVLDANGNGTLSGVVGAFSWVIRNGKANNVKVLNLSWGAPQANSYQRDILSALVEAAWFSGVAVVAAAGNEGPLPGTITTPGSDPFIVTAGSFDDAGTGATLDDAVSVFSGNGPTLDGFVKPDILAPGEHVRSLRVAGLTYIGADGLPVGDPTDRYIYMTGTSASAAIATGIAALVASARRSYTPTQIKGALVASARPMPGSTAGAVDAVDALGRAPATVNVGLAPSKLLLAILTQARLLKVNGVTWEGVTWEGITWESVSWETVTWETVSWETVTWEGVTWDDVMAR